VTLNERANVLPVQTLDRTGSYHAAPLNGIA
jgi:hypothetical protein